MLQACSARKYAKEIPATSPLSDDLRASVEWWIRSLRSSRTRELPFARRQPAAVYTDTMSGGHSAAVVFNPDSSLGAMFRTDIPPWRREYALGIGISECEIICAALGVVAVSTSPPGTTSLVICDNEGANVAVIRRACKLGSGGRFLRSSGGRMMREQSRSGSSTSCPT